eukprot:7702960-Pyramimonas_sp.AAC.1
MPCLYTGFARPRPLRSGTMGWARQLMSGCWRTQNNIYPTVYPRCIRSHARPCIRDALETASQLTLRVSDVYPSLCYAVYPTTYPRCIRAYPRCGRIGDHTVGKSLGGCFIYTFRTLSILLRISPRPAPDGGHVLCWGLGNCWH